MTKVLEIVSAMLPCYSQRKYLGQASFQTTSGLLKSIGGLRESGALKQQTTAFLGLVRNEPRWQAMLPPIGREQETLTA
jgi:hypothetical protein